MKRQKTIKKEFDEFVQREKLAINFNIKKEVLTFIKEIAQRYYLSGWEDKGKQMLNALEELRK